VAAALGLATTGADADAKTVPSVPTSQLEAKLKCPSVGAAKKVGASLFVYDLKAQHHSAAAHSCKRVDAVAALAVPLIARHPKAGHTIKVDGTTYTIPTGSAVAGSDVGFDGGGTLVVVRRYVNSGPGGSR
jgi:hypothetical protein